MIFFSVFIDQMTQSQGAGNVLEINLIHNMNSVQAIYPPVFANIVLPVPAGLRDRERPG